MTGRTHDLAAFSALFGVFLVTSVSSISLATILVSLLFNQIGGILPDIDQPTAPFWKNLPIGRYIGKIVDKTLLGGHRFLTHSIVGVLIFSFLIFSFLNFFKINKWQINVGIVFWSFFIGLVSHLIMDTLTKEGVPWFLPISKKIGIPLNKKYRITTGGVIEHLIITPGLIIFNIILIADNYKLLINFLRQSLNF